MHHYIQRRVGFSVGTCAILASIVQFIDALIMREKPPLEALLLPSVIFVFLTGLIILITSFFDSKKIRIVQVLIALLTGYGTCLSISSGNLTYLIFMALGGGLALEYGLLDTRFPLKISIALIILLFTLVFGMIVINKLSYLVILHSLLGASVVVYLFYLLFKVRLLRYSEQTKKLEEAVAARTSSLRMEMERVKNLKEDLQKTLEEKEHLLAVKDTLLREVHHRTKNNMQLITSFLSLERDNYTDPALDLILDKSMSRIKTLALSHEIVYSSEDLIRINLKSYIERILDELWYVFLHEKIQVVTNIPKEIFTDLDFAIQLGLILNELLNNAHKYAFPENLGGQILIDVELEKETLSLRFRDNGIGLPESVNLETPGTLGLQVIVALAQQAGGSYSISRAGGTEWSFSFPFSDR